MKKTTTMAAIAMTLGMMAFCGNVLAQETDEFNPHLFLQLQGGVGHTVGEASFDELLSPAAAFNVGYSFSPVFSARIGASGWQAKGSLPSASLDYEWNYLQGNLDAMVDICNLLGGFRSDRTFNPYAFAGIGCNYSFNQDDAVVDNKAKFSDPDYVWTESKAFAAGRLGLGLDIRLSKAVYLNIEANTNILSNRFNSKSSDNVDWQSNLVAGLTFHFGGKGHKVKSEPVVERVETPAPAPTPQPQPEPKVEEAPAAMPAAEAFEDVTCNVFFLIDKYDIAESEREKIADLAQSVIAAKTPVKVLVSGYADKETGTDKRNMFLSQKRAEAVRDVLIAAGVPSDIIETKHFGSTVAPFGTPEENRVAICVAYSD